MLALKVLASVIINLWNLSVQNFLFEVECLDQLKALF